VNDKKITGKKMFDCFKFGAFIKNDKLMINFKIIIKRRYQSITLHRILVVGSMNVKVDLRIAHSNKKNCSVLFADLSSQD
jgi:hypothetical protein